MVWQNDVDARGTFDDVLYARVVHLPNCITKGSGCIDNNASIDLESFALLRILDFRADNFLCFLVVN